MHDFMLQYPTDELQLQDKVQQLMAEWQKKSADECFTSDGFYPYYTQQAIKVLFVGREGIGPARCNYIEVLLHAYRQNRIGNKSVNGHAFHRRLLYMLYGIQHCSPEWSIFLTLEPLNKQLHSFRHQLCLSQPLQNVQ